MFIGVNRTSFHLWWKENLVKHQILWKWLEVIFMFLFIIKKYYHSRGSKFFTPFFVKIAIKISTMSRIYLHPLWNTSNIYIFSNGLHVGEIKSIMLRVWKIKSRNAILDVPPRNSCCRQSSGSILFSVATSLS